MTKRKYAYYCSGNASTIIKFYKTYAFNDFPLQHIFYDGALNKIYTKLSAIDSGIKVIHNKNLNRLKGISLNREISDQIFLHPKNYRIDYLFCFGSKILKSPLIDIYENRIINFHPSLLPDFPGLKPIDQVLAYGVKILGNTAHFVDEGIDTGKIMAQSVIHIDDYNDFDDVLNLQIEMLKYIWKNFGTIN